MPRPRVYLRAGQDPTRDQGAPRTGPWRLQQVGEGGPRVKRKPPRRPGKPCLWAGTPAIFRAVPGGAARGDGFFERPGASLVDDHERPTVLVRRPDPVPASRQLGIGPEE